MGGIHVQNLATSVIVALVLAVLNAIVKPVLVLLTLPVTIFTLGLFLLVINAVIVILCSKLVTGFTIDSFWHALLFSILLSVFQSIVFGMTKEKKF
jgi:putative membrane protein